ncbi:MAG: hydroxyethylthiazole kinase [Spartobacteria bacterium]|nr:hydroxyethylthiazole kinase [Spartobacteria bacterium]
MNDEKNATQLKRLWSDVEAIRASSPLVHNITNYVVMEFTANALLAIGAAPVMAHALDEAAEMCRISSALVINIGTLSPPWVEAMLLARDTAVNAKKPVVLDPVGCGATPYRTKTAQRLLRGGHIAVARGNASEVASLQGAAMAQTRGVDSAMGVDAAADTACELARTGAVAAVVVSGAVDLIVDAKGAWRVSNGVPMMSRVTGMGCSASALIGAFCAVNPDPAEAALHAMIVMGVAGEQAAARAPAPGSFKVAFLDALYGLDEATLSAAAKVRRL